MKIPGAYLDRARDILRLFIVFLSPSSKKVHILSIRQRQVQSKLGELKHLAYYWAL